MGQDTRVFIVRKDRHVMKLSDSTDTVFQVAYDAGDCYPRPGEREPVPTAFRSVEIGAFFVCCAALWGCSATLNFDAFQFQEQPSEDGGVVLSPVAGQCVEGNGEACECAAGFELCQEGCANLLIDPQHCGECERSCASGQDCVGGVCRLTCPAGEEACGEGDDQECLALQNNPEHCGLCDRACAEGEACHMGACVKDCPEGFDVCEGACVDLFSNRAHCGGCGNSCGDSVCASGACVMGCPSGLSDCGGQCVDTDSNPAYCGACDNRCAAGEVCSGGVCEGTCNSGLEECGGNCIDLNSDQANCGGCNIRCGANEVCSEGTCALNCSEGTQPCGGDCVDTQLNRSHCSGCGLACGANEICEGGMCVCAEDLRNCSGTCVNTRDDALNCGGCGVRCGANEVCSGGGCQCAAGTRRCDNTQCVDMNSPCDDPDAIYLGSIGPTPGRWQFGTQVGLPGAQAECNQRFGTMSPTNRATVCDIGTMRAAGALGQLVDPAVSIWWVDDPSAPNRERCLEASGAVVWGYGTQHLGYEGWQVSVQPSGQLGPLSLIACASANNHVPCCATR